MKPPRIAPAYACLYPVLARIARRCSYALTIHGSMDRDFDLIAVPWTNDATTPEVLVNSIVEELGAMLAVPDRDPVEHPHGRLVWTIALEGGVGLDFGVMPLRPEQIKPYPEANFKPVI